MERWFKGPAFLAAIVFFLLLTGTAKAQLFLEEGKVVLAVSGGERVNKSIVIHNTSNKSINLKVYWEDFQYQPPYDGLKAFLAAGTSPQSAAQWVTYAPTELTLPPSGQQKIDYTISVPEQIEAGHYGVLFFEDTNPIKDVSGVNIVTRVGSLFFIEPKGKLKKAAIENIQVSGSNLTGDFSNQGNVVLIPRMTYYIMDDAGVVVGRGEVKKLYVPPGATAQWQVTLPENLAAGRYSFVLNSDLEEGEVVVKEIEFVKDASGQLSVQNVKD